MKSRHKILRVCCALLLNLALCIAAAAQNSSVRTVQLQSNFVNVTLAYNVVLPPDYKTSTASRYPVLYLLHGFGGHYNDWVIRTNLADYAAHFRMIVVTPEGNNSWYVDSVGPSSSKYESYILKELIPDVQKRFRTIESRYGRGIAGLSMGGYGALKFGLKSPGTFAFTGSMSGVVGIPFWKEEDYQGLASIRDSVFSAFGPLGSESRKSNDIFEIVRNLSAARAASVPYIYLDCETEDFLVSDNNRFAALLREKKIPHEYRELPGDHSWLYWDRQVREVLMIAAEKLRAGKLRYARLRRAGPTRRDARA